MKYRDAARVPGRDQTFMPLQSCNLPAPAAAGRTHWRMATGRGLAGRCPACCSGALFHGYVKQHRIASHCGLDLLAYRADDAPAYFTILFVGHILVPAMLTLEIAYQFIKQNDRRGRTRDVSGTPPTVALNNGVYTLVGHLLGVSLAYSF